MPELEYFVVSESMAIDRASNSVSIFNVFNEFKVDEFPYLIPKLAIVSCWIASQEELRDRIESLVGIRITGEHHAPADHREHNTSLVCDAEFQHLVLEYYGMSIQGPGKVFVELLLNGQRTAMHTMSFKTTGAE
jgi:hypothetical protein